MKEEKYIGKVVRDTKPEYYGDEGKIRDIRHFDGTNKTYTVVEWGENSQHGYGAIRNYPPESIGHRLRVVE